jgi:GTPase SAR1 family protein|tara:strand:- start:131 stop:571 length:441 start_codon:yes stop_codon:yes gene_type:complete
MKILIYGHSGSGKTTLAKQISDYYKIPHFNGDDVRKMFNDWNFDVNSRKVQALRMKVLSTMAEDCIVDFICPLNMYRQDYDYTIFMNTIEQSEYEDTNRLFENGNPNLEIKKWISEDQLYNCLEDGNLGMTDIQSFLRERLPKLVK